MTVYYKKMHIRFINFIKNNLECNNAYNLSVTLSVNGNNTIEMGKV